MEVPCWGRSDREKPRALGQAALFGYWELTPADRPPAAVVLARLDTGDPWLIERAFRKGRVMLLAGPLDAEGGTLPVNPDFVPLVHELIYLLGDPATTGREARPGEPLSVELATRDLTDDTNMKTVTVTTPGGTTVQAPVDRTGGRSLRPATRRGRAGNLSVRHSVRPRLRNRANRRPGMGK